jgi:hypothetical protein
MRPTQKDHASHSGHIAPGYEAGTDVQLFLDKFDLRQNVYGKKLTIFLCQGALFQNYSHASFWARKICSWVHGLNKEHFISAQEIFLWFWQTKDGLDNLVCTVNKFSLKSLP